MMKQFLEVSARCKTEKPCIFFKNLPQFSQTCEIQNKVRRQLVVLASNLEWTMTTWILTFDE